MPDRRTVELAVLGMSCNGCANSVRNALTDLEGVSDANVDFDKGIAKVSLDGSAEIPDEKLIEAVRDAGYNATLSS